MRNKEMLLIPGPTPVVDSIYDAMASETWSHTDPRFVKIYKHTIDQTREIFNTDGEVFVVAGSGTIGMEMAIVNTVVEGEKLLVVSQGYFGDRFIKLGQAFGIQVDVLQSEWGQQVSPKEIDQKLSEGNYKAVTVTHADTSTGVRIDLEAVVPVIKKHGALVIVDGVCATTAMDEDMSKEYGGVGNTIDIVLTGSQKAIGVPPGIALVAFNQKALEARAAMERVQAYYCDIYNWIPIMHDPSKYFATPAVNLVYALEEGLRIVLEEGLDARIQRHQAFGRAVRQSLAVYGMNAIATEEVAAPTLSCILYPEGIDDGKFRAAMAEKGTVLSGSLAHLAGKAFRIGHMGNTTADMLEKAVMQIGETLNEMGHEVDISKAQSVFAKEVNQLIV
ncbi:serine-pyruvate aminotransferase [Sporosarcina sp. P21c]|uniref:pyridoxal-phosphate-dependent aminotransferase family protein n=1 Tax=unclassified Sporosarcina TaxID=2647733 RepID=UPI000C165342|nr:MULTISPECIES: alanine--glyoxylate aminotransferase family protein [unclassified Sporosarcina]PIC68135.1 serine-pyruvate aminotransferase [Sporosarcina sp. P16a]PIC89020.1 serine-pyruvate aminotransferase [Sporosarcina sp. P21c]PIC94444.1 serine-pyruvate aminotransferase [Sporosarcina sp. P25]